MRIILLILLTTSLKMYAQESYNVEITFKSDKPDSLNVVINNGIEIKDFIIFPGTSVHEDFYMTQYAVFEVWHQKTDGYPPASGNGFFVQNNEANVYVEVNKMGEPIITVCHNAFLFSEFGSEEFLKETKEEFDTFWNFYNDNLTLLGSNDSITQHMFELNKQHNIASAEAIDKLPTNYYNFWKFRTQLAENPDLERIEKDRILNSKFGNYKDTYDYRLIKDLLFGSEMRIGEKFPSIQTKDFINNSLINTEVLNKPLVVVAWATWCAPCIKKMPAIQELVDKYSSCEFVFINHDQDVSRAKQYLRNNPLNGNHINITISSLPQSLLNPIVPKIFVTDRELNIVYNYDLEEDKELISLEEVIKGL